MSMTKCCRDREDPWTNLPTKIGRTVHHWWGGAHHPQRCCHSISANHAICWRCKIFRRRRHVSMSTTKCCGDGEDPWTNSPTTIRRTIHHWWGGGTIISANHAICWRCTIFRRRRRRRCRHVLMSTTKCCCDGEDPWTNSPTTIGRSDRPSINGGGEPTILSTVVIASAPTTPSGQRSSGSLRRSSIK